MAKNPGEKMVEGLALLLQGFSELEDVLEADFGGDTEDKEFSASIVSEVLNAVESLIETEDYTPRYIASVVSALTDALEELDPDLFNQKEQEAAEDKDEEDADDEDDDEEEEEDEDEDDDY